VRLAWPWPATRWLAAPARAAATAPEPPAPRAAGIRSSLVWRLVVLAAGWTLATLVVAGVALSLFFSQEETGRLDTTLDKTLDSLLAGAGVEDGQIAVRPMVDQRSTRAFSGAYWQVVVVDPRAPGQPEVVSQMVRSRSLWDRAIAPPPGGLAALARDPGGILVYDSEGPLKEPLRVAAMQGSLTGIAHPVIFMAAEDRSVVDRDVRRFDTTIALAVVVLGAGLIAAVIAQVRIGLQPLFALRREVAAVRTGKSERIIGRYPSELEPLAAELNALMAHTHEVVERQRTHVGNLAHALKTPLSVLITEAEQQGGPLADVVRRQALAMGQNVDHHLRRARAAARAQGPGERTPVAPVLEDLSRTLEKIFRGRIDEIEWAAPEDLYFLGERHDLLEIAGNILENACKWTAGRVRVEATPGPSPRQLRLTVEDDGPGLPADRRGEVLRRGARLDERTPGSGLGLSIVDELARAYGGSVTLGESAWGGLKAVIILPRAEP
jgi:signal transduction histidine kinase